MFRMQNGKMIERAIRKNGSAMLIEHDFRGHSFSRPEFCELGNALRSRYQSILDEPLPVSILAALATVQVAHAH